MQLREAEHGQPGPDQTTGTRSPRDASAPLDPHLPSARRYPQTGSERAATGRHTTLARERGQPSAAQTFDSAATLQAGHHTAHGSREQNEKDAFGEPSSEMREHNSRSGGRGLGGGEGGSGLGTSPAGHHEGCQTTTLSSRKALDERAAARHGYAYPTEEIPRPSARRASAAHTRDRALQNLSPVSADRIMAP